MKLGHLGQSRWERDLSPFARVRSGHAIVVACNHRPLWAASVLGVLACWASGRHRRIWGVYCQRSSAHRVTDDDDIPFSFGNANCAGKNLALVEMRMVIALLMQRYDIRFAEGFDPQTWEDTLEDWLVMKRGKLPVMITLRA